MVTTYRVNRPYAPNLDVRDRDDLLARVSADRVVSLADPVLDAHLCPLRIHHVSDVHVGPKEPRSARG